MGDGPTLTFLGPILRDPELVPAADVLLVESTYGDRIHPDDAVEHLVRIGEVRIHGTSVPVRAAIETLDGLSAHADRNGILRWLAGFERAPERVWIVHGEPPAARALAAAITERFGWHADVAVDHATVSLGAER